MEHFVRMAFWIVTLSGCLPATSLPITDSSIDLMQQYVRCPSDSTFYTPSNVKAQCVTAALDCFMRELRGTVAEECEDPHKYRRQTVDFLETQIKEQPDNALKNSSECACEKWPQTPFINFLSEMESLLERRNSVA